MGELATVDLLLKNGLIYTSNGFVQGNIVVDEGKIVGIVASDLVIADKAIDLEGKHVLPGFMDTHCHFREPGYTHKEDFESGTKAAAAGGISMAVDMPNTNPVPNTAEKYKEHVRIAQEKTVVDFNRFASPTNMAEIPKIAELGAAGYKIFMRAGIKDTYPYISDTHIGNEYVIYRTFQEIAKTGLPCLVHAWNQRIWQEIYQQCVNAGKSTYPELNEAYETGDHMLVTTAVSELIMFAKLTQVNLRVCHVNYKPIMDLIRDAKRTGIHVSAELNPWLSLPFYSENGASLCGRVTAADYNKGRMNDIWEALEDGTIDVIGSDHSPHTRKEFAHPNAFEAPLGAPSIEHFLKILLTQVNKGNLRLERLVKLCSENPAKELHLYPSKGSIQMGSDADFTVVDMNAHGKLTSDGMYSKAALTPYEGFEFKGAPVYTIVRGNIMMDHGEVIGKRGEGKFITPIRRQNN